MLFSHRCISRRPPSFLFSFLPIFVPSLPRSWLRLLSRRVRVALEISRNPKRRRETRELPSSFAPALKPHGRDLFISGRVLSSRAMSAGRFIARRLGRFGQASPSPLAVEKYLAVASPRKSGSIAEEHNEMRKRARTRLRLLLRVRAKRRAESWNAEARRQERSASCG